MDTGFKFYDPSLCKKSCVSETAYEISGKRPGFSKTGDSEVNLLRHMKIKGRGVAIINKDKYTEKCLQILNTNQFVKLNSDPTKTTERKVQNVLRKIKSKFSPNEYKKLYPTGSSPGKFYGTAKIHKLSQGDQVEKCSIRPIISNIDTATYRLAKHLAKLLSPLSTSEYTLKSTKDFIEKLKTVKVLRDIKWYLLM